MLSIIRAEDFSQIAGVMYVRTQAMVMGFNVPLDKEFDEGDDVSKKYILVKDDIYPIGTCRLHVTGEAEAKIERVAVLEEYRGKGIGRMIIKGAEEWLSELGVKKIIITSREDAVGFYEALGYNADRSKTISGEVFDTVYTEKKLI